MIDTDQKLAAFLPRLRAAEWVALDTEADSLHAYPEKLCLLQMSFPGADELIDPLAAMKLGPLFAELQRYELLMHGADYDLRLLCKHGGFVPTAIFDTMLAARLLGCAQFGLTSLVAQFLDVKLEKGPQKANWARRPLTPRMEAYALNDAHYLQPLADILRAQLTEKGRLPWHRESCQRLIADSTRIQPPDLDLQWRVKGSHQLRPAELGVLRELWQWREAEAIAANKPPFFVLSPDVMVNLALAAVAGRPLEEVMPRHLSPRRRRGISKAAEKGLGVQPSPSPLRHHTRRQSEAERKRLRELIRRRDQRAADLKLDPTLIASRSTLIELAQDWENQHGGLMQWQRELLQA